MLFDRDMRALAHGVVDALFDHIERVEPMREPELNIFCFRWRGSDEENVEIRERRIGRALRS